jgi:hypothetical protein
MQVAAGALDHVNVMGTPVVTLEALADKVTWNVPLPDKLSVETAPLTVMLSVPVAVPA